MTIEVIQKYIEEQGFNAGGEPNYVEIRSPIQDDPAGWYVAYVWMHHDGNIEEAILRGPDLTKCLEQLWEYLQRAVLPE